MRDFAMSLVIIAAVAAALWVGYVPDDAFISYRYADNLAAGNGMRFNADERPVEGYSNFGWIALLAAGRVAGIPPEMLAPVIGLLSFGALLLVVLVAWGIAPFLVLATAAPLLLYAGSGMETPLFALVLALFAVALRERYSVLAAVMAVVLAIVRIEGSVFIVALFTLAVVVDTPRARWSAMAALMAVMFYHTVRVAYFGSVFPEPSGKIIDTPVRAAWAAYGWLVSGNHGDTPAGWYYLLVLLGVVVTARKIPTLYVVAACVVIPVYLLTADWMPGGRYLAPLLVLAAASVTRNPRPTGIAVIILANLWMAAALGNDVRRARVDSAHQEVTARFVSSLITPGMTVATPDVGRIPYRSGARTRDLCPKPLVSRAQFDPLAASVVVLVSHDPDTLRVQKHYLPILRRLRAERWTERVMPPPEPWTGRRYVVFTPVIWRLYVR